MQEQEAIRQCQAGDQKALGTLFELHHLAVFRTAYGITGNYDLAEDVTQQVFIELITAIKRYDPKRHFLPWLHTIAVRRSLDELRRPANRHKTIPDDLPSPGPSPDVEAEKSEQLAAIWTAAGTLGPKHRAVLILRFYHEFSVAEISKALGCSSVTVRVRLHYARARLREILEAGGSPLTDPRLSKPEIHRNGGTPGQAAGSSNLAQVEVEPC